MKAYLINMHLLVPRSRSSAKVKVKYKGFISQKKGRFGGIRVSKTHFVYVLKLNCDSECTVETILTEPNGLTMKRCGLQKCYVRRNSSRFPS